MMNGTMWLPILQKRITFETYRSESGAEDCLDRWGHNIMTQQWETGRVELADWDESSSALRTIRETVFIHEQGVPVELEWDGLDSSCAHVLAWNDRGEAIGTARMQRNGTIGRMAVLKDWRGRGVGQALLQTLLDLAIKQGLARVSLSAQIHALGFYERAGFHIVGEPYMDAGIPHRKIVKELTAAKHTSER